LLKNIYFPVLHFSLPKTLEIMSFSIEKQEKYVLIGVKEGKLDATISPDLKAELVKLNAEGHRNLILDLTLVKYIDSSGLSAILVANRLCQDINGVLVLAGVSEHVMKLIKISQLNNILEILPTVAEAIDSVFMTELEKDFNNPEN
jgi:anti-anti-sigma factor